ncbi:unnamed protein product [Sphenostylis stenocarpa]|uniref:Uncharacterized protein n=1 Tax=Sphenostylis stenocarpa TaxID=92480 RepID=A0AA86T376_9FABA|nr:unnamed protein product [Sphenostylis stenocarpa]
MEETTIGIGQGATSGGVVKLKGPYVVCVWWCMARGINRAYIHSKTAGSAHPFGNKNLVGCHNNSHSHSSPSPSPSHHIHV